ncbi:MAG: helix-turn-helix transcriptional regulator [Candidatus Hydrothermarchaeales archaeon]
MGRLKYPKENFIMGVEMKILYLVILFILLSPPATAQEFHTYSIKADITGDAVYEEVEITFSGMSDLTYVVEGNIDYVSPTSKDGEIAYSVQKGPQSYVVVSNLSGKGHLKLSFSTSAPLLRKDGETEALFKLRFPVNVGDFSLAAVLPEHALPISTEDGYSIFPTPDRQFIEGNRYHILWERNNLKAGDEVTYSVAYGLPKRSYFPYLISLAILLGALSSIYYMRRRKRDLFLRGLGKDERKVIELLLERKEAYQREIREEIGVSKVKMTRIVQRLEEKGLIEKEKHGKRNRLILKI